MQIRSWYKFVLLKYGLLIWLCYLLKVNGCTGKVGRAVLEAAVSAGLRPVPVVLGGPGDAGKIIDIDGMQIEVQVCAASEREEILAYVLKDYPDLIVVDYTVPAAVNGIYVVFIYLLPR